MTAVEPGTRSIAPRSLEVGDLVSFDGLRQTRTGLIFRGVVEGRIVAVWPTLGRLARWTSSVEIEVRDEAGRVDRFLLRRRDRVTLRARAGQVSEPGLDGAVHAGEEPGSRGDAER